jgi:E3 ubiquitin-protein ligase HUWE1
VAQDPELWGIIIQHIDVIRGVIRDDITVLDSSFQFVLEHPDLLDTSDKHRYFTTRQTAKIDRSSALRIKVRRDHILNDSLLRLQNVPAEKLKSRLVIQFEGEPGIDQGGLTKEWFNEVAQEIFAGNFGLFKLTPNRRSSQPLAASSELNKDHGRYFEFAGRIVARAMIEGIPIQAHLTTAFLKQILGRAPTLRDLEESDPVVYNSLVWLQEHPIDEENEMFFTTGVNEITNREIELKPNGAEIRVTEENKTEFVALMVQNLLHDRFADQLSSFCNGFYSLIPIQDIQFFTPSELDLVICGVPEISAEDFKQHLAFIWPYDSSHPVIQRFFNVFTRWDMERRGKLLFFMTGSSQVPLGGFKTLKDAGLPITIEPGGSRDRLPESHTCSNVLNLPEYEAEDEMESKLLFSMYECGTFENV